MNFTNRYGIKSLSIIDALMHDDYDQKGRPANVYTCTEIIDAPKNKVLQMRHEKELVVDIADRLWTFDGSAVHFAVEMSNKENTGARLSEERLYLKISGDKVEAFGLSKGQGITDAPWYDTESVFVTVKFDHYSLEDETIEDYKRTSAWEVVFGLKKSRIEQLNIGALALRLIGFPVSKLRSVLILKNWEKKQYLQAVQKEGNNAKYPPIPYAEFEFTPATIEDSIAFMIERVKLHKAARAILNDDNIPECTPEERWYRGEGYAVMKTGVQRAKKVFKVDGEYTSEMAQAAAGKYMSELMITDSKGKYYVEHRPGVNTRCLEYCDCRQFCSFGRTLTEVTEEE